MFLSAVIFVQLLQLCMYFIANRFVPTFSQKIILETT